LQIKNQKKEMSKKLRIVVSDDSDEEKPCWPYHSVAILARNKQIDAALLAPPPSIEEEEQQAEEAEFDDVQFNEFFLLYDQRAARILGKNTSIVSNTNKWVTVFKGGKFIREHEKRLLGSRRWSFAISFGQSRGCINFQLVVDGVKIFREHYSNVTSNCDVTGDLEFASYFVKDFLIPNTDDDYEILYIYASKTIDCLKKIALLINRCQKQTLDTLRDRGFDLPIHSLSKKMHFVKDEYFGCGKGNRKKRLIDFYKRLGFQKHPVDSDFYQIFLLNSP